MSRIWVDVSAPLNPELTVWPGDPPVRVEAAARIQHGDEVNLSHLSLSAHAGTHMDAPWHFEDDGVSLDRVDTDLFFGDALVIEHHIPGPITAASLDGIDLLPRVLFKTPNSNLPMTGPFRKEYVSILPDAAQRLIDGGVRLVGIDYLSVAPFDQTDQATHHILLGHEVLLVEGLRMKGITPGVHPFIALPLPITGTDGAPCRAFIAQEQ